jgi:predicted MFS family arabinose efflux permease
LALIGNVVSFLVSASLAAFLPATTPEPKSRITGFVAETFAALKAVRANTRLLSVFIMYVGISLAAAMARPALIVLVRDNLHAPNLWYGSALGGIALGSLAASLSALRYRRMNANAVTLFRVGIFVMAAGHLATGLSPVVVVLMLGTLVVGYGNGLATVYGNTLVQQDSPKDSLGVITSLLISGSYLAEAIGSAVGGIAVELIAAPGTFVVAATAMLLCGLFGLAPQRTNHQAWSNSQYHHPAIMNTTSSAVSAVSSHRKAGPGQHRRQDQTWPQDRSPSPPEVKSPTEY